MESFKYLFSISQNINFGFCDLVITTIYIFSSWIILSFVGSFIFLLIGVSGFILFLEFFLILFCFLLGQKYVELHLPVLLLRRRTTYLDVVSDYFNSNFGSKSDEFLPPFIFGYRKYFFSRIVGWKGTWASFLKRHRRRIRSSVFEWGYKNKVPSWHYYYIRGGQRIQILTPNTFRRISTTSYTSPMWFFSFPVSGKWVGYKDEEWDDYNYQIFMQPSDRRIQSIYNEYERPRNRYLMLSSWIEKWAPSLNPQFTNPTYSKATSLDSPYSYFNFPIAFVDSPEITTYKRPPHLGFETEIVYQNIANYETINPRVVPIFRKIMNNEFTISGWRLVERIVTSIGDNYLIDKEALKIKVFQVRYTFYMTSPSKDRYNNYNYDYYTRFQWYHMFLEFGSLIFESLYIYSFETKVVDKVLRIDLVNFPIDFDLNLVFEYCIINSWSLTYLIFFVMYFVICLIFIQMFRWFFVRIKVKLNSFCIN